MTARTIGAETPSAITNLPPETVAKAAKAAREFEAMTLGQLLQPMFDTVDIAHTPFGGGSGEDAFKPMMVNEMAKAITAHGGLGLTAPILAQMLRTQEERIAPAIAEAPGR